MSRQTRRYLRELIAIAAFITLAGVVAAYILDHQRLRWPWEDTYTISATFDTAQAVQPGQGQTVNVAGVKVGEVGDVRLEDGRAVVELQLDPKEIGPVYRDASALLRPKTGLNDMSVSLDPGTQAAGELPERGRILGANTLPNVNPDEVLAALDADARNYLAILANAGGRGLEGRGDDLRAVLRASQPTLEHSARIARAIAARRRELARLVHNFRRLARVGAQRDEQLADLVEASSSVLSTIGAREADVRDAVGRLPGALGSTRASLRESRALAVEARPALRDLLPLARELRPALVRVRPLLEDATPILREDLRPLVREATPLLRELRPAVSDLGRSTPDLIDTGGVLNRVVNELAFNPEGPEEGYLFWTAWFFHNANTILSVEDAHGATWRGLVVVGCSTLPDVVAANPLLQPLAESALCPEAPEGPER